jgi:VanZ family protein
MKMAVFWGVAPGSVVEVYQLFRGPCCLHHQGDRPDDRLHGATTQKTAIFTYNILTIYILVLSLHKAQKSKRIMRGHFCPYVFSISESTDLILVKLITGIEH